MSLTTFSIFYFDFEITNDNKFFNFSEGGPELTAEIEIGSYTATEFGPTIATALNAVGANTYSVSFDRDTRFFTISADANFELLVFSGTVTPNAYEVIGFTGADRTGDDTYTGDQQSGDFYEPQFIIQDHIDRGNFQKLIDPSVNQTAAGLVEVIRFGVSEFIQMNFKWNTNKASDGHIIKNNPTGVEDLQRFMQYITTKKPVEFMADISDRDEFVKLILESTEEESKGTSYKLREMYDRNLPFYFETGKLVFRVQT